MKCLFIECSWKQIRCIVRVKLRRITYVHPSSSKTVSPNLYIKCPPPPTPGSNRESLLQYIPDLVGIKNKILHTVSCVGNTFY